MTLVCQIKKDFGGFVLDINFTADNGVMALLGASGCGKSMTLKCIAGIVKPDSGHIELDGVTLFDSEKGINLPPQSRKVGLLFQDYALFPNMDLRHNIMMGVPKSEKARRDEIVEEMITAFHLQGLENHYPSELSGGQKQRCALARIMAGKPNILMLDEPFSALDSYLRWQVELEVSEILQRFGKTVLLVSHDRDEVFRLSDNITVIEKGHSEPTLTKRELFAAPPTVQAALLSGCKNISPAYAAGSVVTATDWDLHFDLPEAELSGITAVGLRARKILPAYNYQPAEGDVVFEYEIVQEIEDSFSFILMIRRKGTKTDKLIRWEILKSVREEIKNHPPQAVILHKEILLLH